MTFNNPKSWSSSLLFFRMAKARPRLFWCLALALCSYFAQPHDWRLVTRGILAWNVGVWIYLALALRMMMQADHASIRRRARIQDEGRFALLVLCCLSAVASKGAILAELAAVKQMSGGEKSSHIAMAGATVVGSWLFLHMIFALHYAHEFFLPKSREKDTVQGGLGFPDTPQPDYLDFLYFSYVIGVAAQTADVSITSRSMRQVALAHSIVSFFYNAAILALTINIAAGLV